VPVIKGELWKLVDHPAIYTVTTNASINKQGALVMGRGAALQAKQRIPGIEFEAADAILAWNKETGHDLTIPYGFLIVRPPRPDKSKFGFAIFQVKYQWDHPADPNLISCSLSCLRYTAYTNKDLTIRMNYPGIGFGRLPISEVEPMLTDLPKNVFVTYK